MQKKYNFNSILAEYNKTTGHTYNVSLTIFNAVILYTVEKNLFNVTYTDKSGEDKCKKSLVDFLYYHVSNYLISSDIIEIIRSKEEEELNLKIEIWPSSKIRYAYLSTNYFIKDVGHLGKSCMRTKDMQKSLNFYIKNNAKIVVVIDNKNKIHARALLWDNIKSTRNKKVFTYLDRVYTRSDVFLSLFRKLAEESKWEQYGSTSAGEARSNLYKDNLDIVGMCHLPYTDTFRYLYYKDNLVASCGLRSNLIKHGEYLNLTTTGNGGYFPTLDPDRTKEVFTGNYVSKKDATFIKRYGGYVLKRHIVDINGTYYSSHDRDNIIKTQLDEYILKENLVNEAITNSTMDKSIAVYSPKYDKYVHKSNVVNIVVGIKKEVYHKQDTNIVCFNIETNKSKTKKPKTKWYHISECFINYDRKKLNKELAKSALTPKGNKIFTKQSKFFDKNIPRDYMRYLALVWSFAPDNDKFGAVVIRQDNLIPKEHAIVAYDLAYNSTIDNIEYQEVYYNGLMKDTAGFIKLATGEFIVDSRENRKHLKKFNNKYCIKQDFKPPNKNQLTLF